MVNKKSTVKVILLSISFCFVFSLGYFIAVLSRPSVHHHFPTALRTFTYFYNEIEENFGIITQYDEKEYDVIGGIHWKDMSLPIIMENGVKTIRAYKYIYKNE
jgi:hypothetical protein